MSIQSSINNMLAGFGYLTGQNAQAKREKRQYKIEQAIHKKAWDKAANQVQGSKDQITKAGNIISSLDYMGVNPSSPEYRAAYNQRLRGAENYGRSWNNALRAEARYTDASRRYSESIIGKTNKQAIKDIEEAERQEEALSNAIPAGEQVIQNLEQYQDEWMSQPDVKELQMDEIDRAGMEAMSRLYNITSQAMNQQEALKERFGYRRNG